MKRLVLMLSFLLQALFVMPAEVSILIEQGKKQHRIRDVAPHHIHKVEVHEGEGDKSGNICYLSSTKQNAFLDYRFRRKIDIVHSDNLATTLSKSYNREKISYLKNHPITIVPFDISLPTSVHNIMATSCRLLYFLTQNVNNERDFERLPEGRVHRKGDTWQHLGRALRTGATGSAAAVGASGRVGDPGATQLVLSTYGKKQHRIHDVARHHIHKVEVHEGEWDKSDNIKVLP
ncbi:hypothetical protein JHK87_055039 [Glycine soja]|nr:hypothetical protein JHK87_055039 [Glycine soja]